MKKHTVSYNNRTISFLLQRKRVKNINLRVRNDATVAVSANETVPLEVIERFVLKNAAWIIETRSSMENKKSVDDHRAFISGEIIHYLGDPYHLEVMPSEGKEELHITGDKILLKVKDSADFQRKEHLYHCWCKEEAQKVFARSLDTVYPLVASYKIEKPSITIRKMKTRWGSCSWDKGKITLNSELLKMPQACIDYVVLHELAHFRHKKHDRGFYNFLSSIMPGWEQRRKILKDYNRQNLS